MWGGYIYKKLTSSRRGSRRGSRRAKGYKKISMARGGRVTRRKVTRRTHK